MGKIITREFGIKIVFRIPKRKFVYYFIRGVKSNGFQCRNELEAKFLWSVYQKSSTYTYTVFSFLGWYLSYDWSVHVCYSCWFFEITNSL